MQYQCPMGCEGQKTYAEPGKCPVCGMKLIPVKDSDSDSQEEVATEKDHPSHHHSTGNHACICETPGCDGGCVENCQCSFQDLNLALPMISSTAKALSNGYACPMHCEGDKTYPTAGDCPICGMHMVQVIAFGAPQATDGNAEIVAFRKMRNRFILAAIVAVPILILSMGELVPGLGGIIAKLLAPQTNQFIQFGLSVPVVLFAAAFIFHKGYQSIIRWKLNMFTLIALGTGVAWTFSVVATLVPNIFPQALRRADGLVPVYFEATVIIITLVILGQMLELLAHAKTNSAIKELLTLVPASALVIRNGVEQDIPLAEVVVGDHLRVKPGDKIPVDGVLVDGKGVVDEAMITGEPIPVEKNLADGVTGGTINLNGSFVMAAQKVGGDTLLARIVQMVNEASRSKAPIQRLADKVAAYFVQAVVVLAVLTFLVWGLAFAKWDHGLVNAIAVLIIACPCALGLATPVSIMVGTGIGAKSGILIKNAKAIERMRQIDTLLVDKTGTLTLGKPTVVIYKGTAGWTDDEVLRLAASVDQQSEHPLAAAITAAAHNKGMPLSTPSGFISHTGQGATALVEDHRIAVGNEKLLATLSPDSSKSLDLSAVRDLQTSGHTVMFVLRADQLIGYIGVIDPIKESTPEAVKRLHHNGVKVVMMTGDNKRTAAAVASTLGLENFRAECLPEDKFNEVKTRQNLGAVVGMAGDGINDAPALTQADVGIAMGTGTDIAMESADITLVKGDLIGIAKAKDLSIKVMRNIRQNLFFAFAYNIIGIPIAALGWLNPVLAGLAMALSSVSVLGNALRIKRSHLR